jgi:hypothetical protein
MLPAQRSASKADTGLTAWGIDTSALGDIVSGSRMGRRQDQAAAQAHLIKKMILNGNNGRVMLHCHCGEVVIGTGDTRAERMASAEQAMAVHRAKNIK